MRLRWTGGGGFDQEVKPPALTDELDEGDQMVAIATSGACPEILQVPCGGCGEHLVYVGAQEISEVFEHARQASRAAGGAWVMLACKRCREELAKGMSR